MVQLPQEKQFGNILFDANTPTPLMLPRTGDRVDRAGIESHVVSRAVVRLNSTYFATMRAMTKRICGFVRICFSPSVEDPRFSLGRKKLRLGLFLPLDV